MEQNKTAQMPQIQQSKVDEMFTMVTDKQGTKICLGNYQISKKIFKNFENAEKYLAKKPYEILINVAYIAASKTIEDHENKSK